MENKYLQLKTFHIHTLTHTFSFIHTLKYMYSIKIYDKICNRIGRLTKVLFLTTQRIKTNNLNQNKN